MNRQSNVRAKDGGRRSAPFLHFLLPCALLLAFVATGCVSRPGPFPVVQAGHGIFIGRKPWKKTDFQALRAHGVHTILNLEVLPWNIWPERAPARRVGIQCRHVPIIASPLRPSDKAVRKALQILNDGSQRPIFVHCYLGEDRAAFIVGLYRVYFENWTPQAAWEEMLRSGFHSCFRLRGLTTYFWEHSEKPDWARALARREPP